MLALSLFVRPHSSPLTAQFAPMAAASIGGGGGGGGRRSPLAVALSLLVAALATLGVVPSPGPGPAAVHAYTVPVTLIENHGPLATQLMEAALVAYA